MGNLVVDSICFLLLIFLHALVLDGILGIIPKDGSPLLSGYYFLLYISYYTLFEFFLGKTPGKFMTRTRVVGLQGERPDFRTVLWRSLCRLIPFEGFVYLYEKNIWHDTLSKTQVVMDV